MKITNLSHKIKMAAAILSICFLVNAVPAQKTYFPPAGEWERRTPEQAKFDPGKLKEAIDFAIASEAKGPRSQELGLTQSFGQAPFGELVGPTKDRGDLTGLVIRNGHLVAEWGEPFRVDMTHSVTKSFLSSVVGMAFDRKLI
ncbi:MAG: serine hydrolase, partial [Pyrinomonadaceae bacterium]